MATERNPWVEASDVIPMFPTLVWKLQLRSEVHQPMDARILALLDGMRRELPALGFGQGWQSEQGLHARDELREFVGYVDAAAKTILRFLKIGTEAVEVTACWANVLAPGAAHRAHSHPNNFLSAVYYLRTHPGGDTIQFHDPRAQTGIIRPPVTELTAENTDQVVVQVRNGELLLFPAYVQHSVAVNAAAEERISLSCNLMFSSFTENLSKTLW